MADDVADGGYLFISYARADADYVEKLVPFLRNQNVPVWYDREAPTGARWKRLLASRVEHAAAVVLVASPRSEDSHYAGEEVTWALRCGRPLLTIVIEGAPWFGIQEFQAEFHTDMSMPTATFLALARQLVAAASSSGSPRPAGKESALAPAQAWEFPRRPPGMVDRPAQVDQIVAALLSETGLGTVAVTGVYGGGGLGKTVVAQMVCERDEVQTHFPGGLLWVDLGKERRGAALAELIGDLCVRLGGDQPGLVGTAEAGEALAALLKVRRPTLVVLDDAWFDDQTEPFLEVDAGPARFMVTTRVGHLVPAAALAVPLEMLDADQSRAVLLAGLPSLPEPTIDSLLKATGGWALVVNSTNAMLRRAVRDGADPANYAAWLADRLGAEGIDILQLGNQGARDRTFAAIMDPSLALLTQDQQRRVDELSIFAEDTDIDLNLLALLWRVTGDLTPSQTRALAAQLKDLNLATDFRPDLGILRLHDLVRAHLAKRLGPQRVRRTHSALLEAADRHYGIDADPSGVRAWWNLPATGTYLWHHLVEHLVAADREFEVDELLSDLRWTQAKLLGVGIASLDADLARSTSPTVAGLRQAVWREAHLLGPVEPAHSYGDILAARLGTLPSLTRAVDAYRRAMPGQFVHTRPGWRLPDAPDDAARRVLSGHEDWVASVAIAPDGTWLATTSNDRTVRLWDAATGTRRATLVGHRGTVTGVAIAPDGTWLATTSDDATVRLWETFTGVQRATLTGHTTKITGVAIAPDGTWLVTTGIDSTVRLWNSSTGDQVAVFTAYTLPVAGVAIAPDGTWLAATSETVVRRWDVSTGARRAMVTDHWVTGLAIAPNGAWLVTAGRDGTARLWDVATGACRATLAGHAGAVTGVAVAPDGTWLATTGDDGTVRLWDTDTHQERAVLTGHARKGTGVAIAADGAWLATSSLDRTVRLWDATAGQRRRASTGQTPAVAGVSISRGGALLATVGRDHTVRLWDAATGIEQVTLRDATDPVSGVAVASDSAWLATTGTRGTVRLWDAATGHERATLKGHTGTATRVAIAPDGTWLVVAGAADGTVRLWDAATGHERARLKGHTGTATRVVIAPDGTWIATTGTDGTVRLWDVRQSSALVLPFGRNRLAGAERATLARSTNFYDLAITSSGTLLGITTSYSGRTVHLWEIDTGLSTDRAEQVRHRAAFTGHSDTVTGVAIATDGAWAATTSDDQTVRLWNAATGENVATMRVASPLSAVCVGPDGRTVYAGGPHGPYRFDVQFPLS